MHVGSVVIDCNDLSLMLGFWERALGYVRRDPPGDGDEDFVVLCDPVGARVNVSLQVVPESRIGKNRLHLDLYTGERAAEVRRLLGLGATLHARPPEPDDDFVPLQDPEGNVFCVVDAPPSTRSSRADVKVSGD